MFLSNDENGRVGDIHQSSERQSEGSGGLKQQKDAAKVAVENMKNIDERVRVNKWIKMRIAASKEKAPCSQGALVDLGVRMCLQGRALLACGVVSGSEPSSSVAR
jgi:hypothetical protein